MCPVVVPDHPPFREVLWFHGYQAIAFHINIRIFLFPGKNIQEAILVEICHPQGMEGTGSLYIATPGGRIGQGDTFQATPFPIFFTQYTWTLPVSQWL